MSEYTPVDLEMVCKMAWALPLADNEVGIPQTQAVLAQMAAELATLREENKRLRSAMAGTLAAKDKILAALRASRNYWRELAHSAMRDGQITATTLQGADDAIAELRARIRDLEAAQARQLATITELQARLDNYSRAFATITPPGETA